MYTRLLVYNIQFKIKGNEMNSWDKLGKTGATEMRFGFECTMYVMNK